ncbi:MAG: adenylosuccinate synthetase [Thermoprotei archaeon]|nr:MAG: adenylosuccinate synthetase [Thermoprotei archaeon]RLG81836.1 MAG: adenylosuccinate synthetase [Thermoprotei archaeon]
MLVVIVGGFFGDEGKGKVASYLGLVDRPDIAIRCGAVNAGHTVVYRGRIWKLRTLSSAFLYERARLLIPPGALTRLDVLFKEIDETNARGRVVVDYRTGIISEEHVNMERRSQHLSGVIGSTLQGVGAAMADRVLRRLKLAEDYPVLKDMLGDAPNIVNEALDKGQKVLVEGTQGTFLSLYHGTYPYVTSRDTTASAFISEIGVGPKRVDEVIVVFKSYITRVGKGPLPGEIPVDEAEKKGMVERASVTGRLRRVAPFSVDLARRAIVLNSATQAALTKIDILFPEARGVKEWNKLPKEARKWIEELEDKLGIPVTLVSTGEDSEHMIDRRRDYGLL